MDISNGIIKNIIINNDVFYSDSVMKETLVTN